MALKKKEIKTGKNYILLSMKLKIFTMERVTYFNSSVFHLIVIIALCLTFHPLKIKTVDERLPYQYYTYHTLKYIKSHFICAINYIVFFFFMSFFHYFFYYTHQLSHFYMCSIKNRQIQTKQKHKWTLNNGREKQNLLVFIEFIFYASMYICYY